MAHGFRHTCNNCGYSVETSGEHEFYRDSNGEKKPYGHPCPLTEEAEKAGIHGFYGHFYCSKCDKRVDIITTEFKEPGTSTLGAWVANLVIHYRSDGKSNISCPECGNSDVFLAEAPESVTCPHCGKGKFISENIWVS